MPSVPHAIEQSIVGVEELIGRKTRTLKMLQFRWLFILSMLMSILIAQTAIANNRRRISSKALKEKNETIQNVEKFLTEGEYAVDMEGYSKVIALLGMSGTGKSTIKKLYLREPNLMVIKAGTKSARFLFTDGGNQISLANETSKSKTLIPITTIDPSSGALFIDCPGFSDTRGVAEEIAASYMIKKVLDQAEQVKFIVVENHAGLINGGDRYTIRTFLRHLATFIPDVDRLRGSIGFIANKAEKSAASFEDEEDEVIEVLENFKDALLENSGDEKGGYLRSDEIAKMSKLIDIINAGDQGDNVVVVYRPNKEGSPWDIDYMNKSVNNLNDMIENKLQFADNRGIQYNYSLSAQGVALIKDDLIPIKSAEIERLVVTVLESFRQQLNQRIREKKIISEKTYVISALIKDVASQLQSASKYSDFLSEIATSSGFVVDADILQKIKKVEKLFLFFMQMARVSRELSTIIQDQNIISEKFLQPLNELQLYYNFMRKLEEGLQSFEAHLNRERFIGLVNVKTGINSMSDYENLIFNLSILKIAIADSKALVSINSISTEMFNELNALLKKNLDYEVVKQYDSYSKELTVKGKTVLLSEAAFHSQMYPEARNIKIFAWQTLFVDGNFQLTDANLAMVAPSIKVVVRTVIKSTASDSAVGKSGKSSGFVYISALKIDNPSRLSVISTGGRGGKGIAGEASSCHFPSIPQIYISSGASYGDITTRLAKYHYEILLDTNSESEDNSFIYYRSYYNKIIFKVTHPNAYSVIAATTGRPGGKGGYPGKVTLKTKSSSSSPVIVENQGESGVAGDPGFITPCFEKIPFLILHCEEKTEKNTFAKTKYHGFKCSTFSSGFEETANDVVPQYRTQNKGVAPAESSQPPETPSRQITAEYLNDSKSFEADYTVEFSKFIR
ncbi:uncharacterized protein LOC132195505 isoform X1 [Neocloeon triangulifer]|uniref:uncharacterized protein LOC132195505 isoform X1 n=1 Tax=Neocloeon triangulifer TaxID=2078957 RepID=UPI00286F1E9E|nr:uncharacterized protein LOC132195505 isoform X1 [Neocloeon triangulifer]